ncbi:unnamed protein product [Rotaria magnacalcarata]|uniref:ZZ-type domain-containing protein n=1 Tax=Rotaria magnacalcarata TaxID=392030 RepID=A0A815YD54_9BILA|nr:unnamed protein product [Rotaria magnacalcarata]CAF4102301.1 unnamed protein product [Rotaria magnacalcarata]
MRYKVVAGISPMGHSGEDVGVGAGLDLNTHTHTPSPFILCNKCLSQSPILHTSVHKFSRLTTSDDLLRTIASLEHLDVICDGCSMAPLKGIRHQYEQCVPSFDLCDYCLGKSHTHHTLKIIPHTLLHSVNRKALAQRDISLANLNGVPKWRDPLTG